VGVVGGGSCGGELHVGEEAVVEVGAFDYEMSEEVIGVPKEEELVFGGDGLW